MNSEKENSILPATVLLREDLSAFSHAIKRKANPNIPIFANRFCSDAYLLPLDNLKIPALFVGGLLRIIAEDFTVADARQRQTNIQQDEHITIVEDFCTILNDSIPSLDKDIIKICKAYYDLQISLSKFERDIHEIEAYSNDEKINISARESLSHLFEQYKSDIPLRESQLIYTIINEMARFSHVTSFNEKDLCMLTILKCFALPYEFIRIESFLDYPDKNTMAKLWIEKNTSIIQEFLNDVSEHNIEDNWIRASKLIADYIGTWRIYWIRYGDIQRPTIQPIFGVVREEKEPTQLHIIDPKKIKGKRVKD